MKSRNFRSSTPSIRRAFALLAVAAGAVAGAIAACSDTEFTGDESSGEAGSAGRGGTNARGGRSSTGGAGGEAGQSNNGGTGNGGTSGMSGGEGGTEATGGSGEGGSNPRGGMGGTAPSGGVGGGGAAGTGGSSGGASGVGGVNTAGGGAGGAPVFGSDWATWPMPNPVSAMLPNPSSYTDHGDGTVTDNVTRLVWQKVVSDGAHDHAGAVEYCAT